MANEVKQSSGKDYEVVIGLETHVQLDTVSKAFCGDATVFADAPNTHVGAVSLALPGALPRANTEQIRLAVRLGLALGCTIHPVSFFDRKNYFYVDLPKGYQITQDRQPICTGGAVRIRTSAGERTIRIHHIHMEEDAGKSIHDRDPQSTLVDLNRAGTPLLEIVSEPDLRNGEEVDAYMSELQRLVRWLGVSSANMERGELRCDVNLSIRPRGSSEFGTRCEIKNMNSMRYARRAIQYETKRQIRVVEGGGEIFQSTLNFDPKTGKTTPLRRKENAHDYRYFPDPDLPPVVLRDELLAEERARMPDLPRTYEVRFAKLGLSKKYIDQLSSERTLAEYFSEMLTAGIPAKSAANFLINQVLPNHPDPATFPVAIDRQKEFLALIDGGKLDHGRAMRELLPALEKNADQSVDTLATELDLLQSEDASEVETLARQVLEQFPDKVKAYRNGKKGLIGMFMGELMKTARGKANPKVAREILTRLLE